MGELFHLFISHRILGCIKSGPGDLDVFKSVNLSKIFSLEKFKVGQGYLVVFDEVQKEAERLMKLEAETKKAEAKKA